VNQALLVTAIYKFPVSASYKSPVTASYKLPVTASYKFPVTASVARQSRSPYPESWMAALRSPRRISYLATTKSDAG